MIRKAVLAAGMLAGLAAPALADVSFPDSFTTSIGNGPGGGTVIAAGTNGDELSAVGSNFTGYFFFGSPGVYSLQYLLTFNGPVPLGGDLHLIIYNWVQSAPSGSGTPVSTLSSISWTHGSETATWNGIGLGLNTGDTVSVSGANDLSNYTLSGGFDRALVDGLVLTFNYTTIAGGEFFAFDAVSNPEPGTMALFGLGALGLGGLAWRRRKLRLRTA